VNLNEALKEAGRSGAGVRGNRLRAALVVAEVAFAVALMVSAGLLASSLRALNQVRLGYDTRGTVGDAGGSAGRTLREKSGRSPSLF